MGEAAAAFPFDRVLYGCEVVVSIGAEVDGAGTAVSIVVGGGS